MSKTDSSATPDEPIQVRTLPSGCLGTLVCSPGKEPYVLQLHNGETLTLSLPNIPVWTGDEEFTSLPQNTSVLITLMGYRYIVGPCRIISLSEPVPTPEVPPEVPPKYSLDTKTEKTTIEIVTIHRQTNGLFGVGVGIIDERDTVSSYRCKHRIVYSEQSALQEGDEILGIWTGTLPCRTAFIDCTLLTHEELVDTFRKSNKIKLRIQRQTDTSRYEA